MLLKCIVRKRTIREHMSTVKKSPVQKDMALPTKLSAKTAIKQYWAYKMYDKDTEMYTETYISQ